MMMKSFVSKPGRRWPRSQEGDISTGLITQWRLLESVGLLAVAEWEAGVNSAVRVRALCGESGGS